MAHADVQPQRTSRAFLSIRLFLVGIIFSLVFTLGVGQGTAGVVRSLQGSGNFHTYVDVINRWETDERLDVMVLVEVTNADLGYKTEEKGYVGRLRVEVELISPDGEVVKEKRPYRTQPLSREEASSSTLFQNVGLVLEDVPFRNGRLVCRVYDVNRRKEGILNEMRKQSASSYCSTQWYAPDSPRPSSGVLVGDPLYLFLAPFEKWRPGLNSSGKSRGQFLHDHIHPSRRYGIEQDKLQVFLPIWPPAGGLRDRVRTSGLLVQINSLDMAYGITDTLHFDELGLNTLEAGLPAGLFYSLDVNLLPEGPYQLSAAPLGGQGEAQVSGFDVIWRLDALGRHRDRVLAEGSIIFEGRRLQEFRAASPAEQEIILDTFWDNLNPDPENPVNEAYLEFQYRMSYVQQFLGGFNKSGPVDERGLVFILMGPADEVQSERLPRNFRDKDDARIKVFQRFAPDRLSDGAKGAPAGGTQGSRDPYDAQGGIPMPYSYRADKQRETRAASPTQNFGFELWKYDGRGYPLFPNRFSRSSMGSRFLFVDRTGAGDYRLESSNVVQGEE
jgi:GWxTD domain-containing protein